MHQGSVNLYTLGHIKTPLVLFSVLPRNASCLVANVIPVEFSRSTLSRAQTWSPSRPFKKAPTTNTWACWLWRMGKVVQKGNIFPSSGNRLLRSDQRWWYVGKGRHDVAIVVRFPVGLACVRKLNHLGYVRLSASFWGGLRVIFDAWIVFLPPVGLLQQV